MPRQQDAGFLKDVSNGRDAQPALDQVKILTAQHMITPLGYKMLRYFGPYRPAPELPPDDDV